MGGPSKETLGFHGRALVRPPASSRFSKRPSSPCPGSPRRGTAASEATTERKAGPELWALSTQAAQRPCEGFWVRFHWNNDFHCPPCKKKGLEATV